MEVRVEVGPGDLSSDPTNTLVFYRWPGEVRALMPGNIAGSNRAQSALSMRFVGCCCAQAFNPWVLR